MKTNWAFILSLSSILLAAPHATAQEELYLELKTPGITRLNFAFLPLADSAPWNQALRGDLEESEVFTLVEPAIPTGKDPIKYFESLKSQGVDFFLSSTMENTGGALTLHHTLYEVASKKVILSKNYRGPAAALPGMAHTLADELILYLTGQKGLSLTKIAFVGDRTGHKEIWLMDADGAGQQPLTVHKSISFSPAWSPDGKRIYYASYLYGQPSLLELDWLEARVRRLATGVKVSTAPSPTPDGAALVFAGADQTGNTDVYRLTLATGAVERLTFARSIDTDPRVSPVGNSIVFTSDRIGSPQIFLMDSAGLDVRRLTPEGVYNAEPQISPDGKLLVYDSREGNNFQIYLQDMFSGARVRLTRAGGNESPSFSPNGKKILFSSNRTGSYQIYAMDLNGNRIRQLTTVGNNTQPAWGPYLK
jgi:TolB protein